MGIVYLTDRNGNQILKFYSNSTFIETIGSKGAGPGQFDGPHGIAIDSDNDNVYITDMKNHRVQVFDSNDSFIRQWGILWKRQDNSRTPHRVLQLINES